jgi:DNA-binding MarR family transcriptional regulator
VLQRPNRKLSLAEIDQLVADYQAGLCLTELGKRYGLHRQTAKAHLERRGVTIRSELPALTPDQVQAAGHLYDALGLSLVQLANRFEVAPNTLRRALASAGYRIRPRGYCGRQSK